MDRLDLPDATVDLTTGVVHGGSEALTAREVSLLRYLVARPRQDVTREALLVEVLGYAPGVHSRAVDAAMKRIRRKLGAGGTALRTAHGVGYRYEPTVGTPATPEAPPVAAAAPLQIGAAVVDPGRREVTVHGRTVSMTPREAQLLGLLLAAGGEVVDSRALGAAGWDTAPGPRVVAAALRRLRAKLEADPAHPRHLLSVRGSGYRLRLHLPDVGRARLPDAVSPYGRRAEHRRGLAALEAPGGRLLLLGPGGAGKTTLSVALARARVLEGTDAWFVDARGARTADELCAAVGSVVGGGDDAAAVGRALAGHGDPVVVLDNLEQVSETAGPLVGAWVQRAPDVRWILTSRHRVEVPGLTEIRLASLGLEAGVALFLDRARQRVPAFDADRALLEDIVGRLDGLPLAIELAAARAGHLAPERLRDHLVVRPLAVAGRALIDVLTWSWRLLGEGERSALGQLSWFRGPFDAQDAEAVLGPDAEAWAPDVLASLVARSLLVHWPDRQQYGWLDHVRVFAAERAGARGADRWADRVLTVGERALAELEGRDVRGATAVLSARRTDLLAVLDHHPDPERRVRAALVLDQALYFRGPWSTRARVLELAVDLAEAVPQARAAVLIARSDARRQLGELDRAEADLRAAMEHAHGRTIAEVHRGLGKVLRDAGDLAGAVAEAERGLALHRAAADRLGEAAALADLAACALAIEPGEAALPPVREALRVNRVVGRRRSVGLCLAYLGLALTGLGRHAEAAEAFTEALGVFEDVATGAARGGILADLARLRLERGRLEGSGPLIRFAVGWFDHRGDPFLAGQCLLHLGMVLHLRGEAEAARGSYAGAATRLHAAQATNAALLAEAHIAAADADLGEADAAGARLARLRPADALGAAVVELCRAHVDRARGAADALEDRLRTADAVADASAQRNPVLRIARMRVESLRTFR